MKDPHHLEPLTIDHSKHSHGYGAYDHEPHGCPKCPDGSKAKCYCWCTPCTIELGGVTDGKTPCPGCGLC